jgi:hypothetical protein
MLTWVGEASLPPILLHSTAQHSTAQHSTAQHSTAQHSTAQHSTAQHSTAQHSTSHYYCVTQERGQQTMPTQGGSKFGTTIVATTPLPPQARTVLWLRGACLDEDCAWRLADDLALPTMSGIAPGDDAGCTARALADPLHVAMSTRFAQLLQVVCKAV